MTLKAILENHRIIIYREDNAIFGTIETDATFENFHATIDQHAFQIIRNKWEAQVLDNGKDVAQLKINSFSGNIAIIPNGYKITSAKSLKWGTKLIDNHNNELLRIRHDNLWINNNRYHIKIKAEKTTPRDILFGLFGHVYGSYTKNNALVL